MTEGTVVHCSTHYPKADPDCEDCQRIVRKEQRLLDASIKRAGEALERLEKKQ